MVKVVWILHSLCILPWSQYLLTTADHCDCLKALILLVAGMKAREKVKRSFARCEPH